MEKRRSHRIRVKLQARYRSASVAMDGMVSSLSCEGVFLRSDFLDAAGSAVDLHLRLPGSNDALSLTGEVVRIDEAPLSSGMGIRFRAVNLPTRLQLANFMLLETSRVLS